MRWWKRVSSMWFGPPPLLYAFLLVCVALFGMLLSGGALAIPGLGPWLGRWGPRLVTGAALLLLAAFILYRLDERNFSLFPPGGRDRTGNDHGKCPRLHLRYCAIAAVALWGATLPLFVSRLRAWRRTSASEPLRGPLLSLFSASAVCLFFLWRVGSLDGFTALPSEEDLRYLAQFLHARLFKA